MSYIPTRGNSTLRSHNNTNFVFDQSSRQVHSSPPRRRHRYTQRPLDSLSTFASTFKVSRILSTSIRRRVNAKAKKDMERYAPFLAPLWLALSVARYSFAERRLTYRSCVNYPLSLLKDGSRICFGMCLSLVEKTVLVLMDFFLSRRTTALYVFTRSMTTRSRLNGIFSTEQHRQCWAPWQAPGSRPSLFKSHRQVLERHATSWWVFLSLNSLHPPPCLSCFLLKCDLNAFSGNNYDPRSD